MGAVLCISRVVSFMPSHGSTVVQHLFPKMISCGSSAGLVPLCVCPFCLAFGQQSPPTTHSHTTFDQRAVVLSVSFPHRITVCSTPAISEYCTTTASTEIHCDPCANWRGRSEAVRQRSQQLALAYSSSFPRSRQLCHIC